MVVVFQTLRLSFMSSSTAEPDSPSFELCRASSRILDDPDSRPSIAGDGNVNSRYGSFADNVDRNCLSQANGSEGASERREGVDRGVVERDEIHSGVETGARPDAGRIADPDTHPAAAARWISPDAGIW